MMEPERKRIENMLDDKPEAICPNCKEIVIPKRVDHFPNMDSKLRWCPKCLKGKAGCYWRLATDYLAKAGELCPKKIFCSLHCGGYDLNCSECMIAIYKNETIDLCLPIVADLLKRVDELTSELEACREANVQKKKRIAELEEEVRKLRLLNDTLTNNVMVEDSPALKVMVETSKHLSDELKKQSDYAVAAIDKINKERDRYKQALEKIVKHHELIGSITKLSATLHIAKQSLEGKR